MQRIRFVFLAVFVGLLPVAAAAQSGNSSVQAFGGLTFSTSDVVGGSTAPTFGGAVQIGLTPHIQIVGEGGHLSDVSPGFYDLLDLTSVGVDLSAWYAQAGVRLIASPRAAVRPYGEATAGVARLRTDVAGLDGRAGRVLDIGLGFLDRNEPMYGLGAGVLFGAGPLAVDVGYRYKHLRASGLASIVNAGDAVGINEVRVGVGVRF